MLISWPASKPLVQALSALSTRRTWSVHRNLRWSFWIIDPGSRCDSVRIWKPLQIPRTGIPPFAAVMTSPMTGAKRAMAPARR